MITKTIFTLLMVAVSSTSILLSTSSLYGQDDAPKKPEVIELEGTMEGGKLFIVDEDGEKQEVDTASARSVSISNSVKVVEQDGEIVQVVGGIATIVEQDGQKKVIRFENADGDAGMNFGVEMHIGGMHDKHDEQIQAMLDQIQIRAGNMHDFPRGPNVFRMNRGEVGKYMVGVHCSPVSEVLRGHLQLDESIGLMVDAVSPDSPAFDAGIEQHDILLFADDQSVATRAELTKAVELAGEEGRALTLTYIHRGEEQTAEVTPKERPAGQANRVRPHILWPDRPGQAPQMPQFRIQELGPGVIIPGPGAILPDDMNPEMDEIIQRLQKDMEQMRLEIRGMNLQDR